MPELLLCDLERHFQVVEQRGVNVAELMPRYPFAFAYAPRRSVQAGAIAALLAFLVLLVR